MLQGLLILLKKILQDPSCSLAPSHFTDIIPYLSPCDPHCTLALALSCSLSRPGRFTWDSSRQKKIRGAVGMSDVPLLWGGAIHACCKPQVAPWEVLTPLCAKCTQSRPGANTDLQLYNRASCYACGPLLKVI